eukprot:gene18664-biopygen18908
MKGLEFGWCRGVPKVCVSIARMICSSGCSENALSNDRMGREPFRQLPGIFNSSMVCTLLSRNRMDGPSGTWASHM